MRVGIYCRVSTRDQSVDMQLVQLREYAQRRGWEIAGEYLDKAVSGSDLLGIGEATVARALAGGAQ